MLRPQFLVLADRKDVTEQIKDRLIFFSLADRAGTKSDELTITVDDRDDVVVMPRKGAVLDVRLGYKQTGLSRMGIYTADEVSHSGPPATLTIKAKAADMRQCLKVRKTRSWDNTTLGEIVSIIASEHGSVPAISPTLASVPIGHVDQTDESDMHLLTRLAKDHDAVFKPASDHLILAQRGETKTVTGKTIPPVALEASQITRWTLSAPDRGKYQSVIAHWHNPNAAELMSVTIGQGDPVYTLPGSFPDQNRARAAAEGKLKSLTRGKATLRLTTIGNPALMAEAPLKVSGLSTKVDGQWLITAVDHKIDSQSGYICNVSAEFAL
ncbi:MAG: hypothetical protein CR984_03765 [Proteobacteria bacterium]|nr:MAG: hypothetical protein CR984_03765 [Pseudomonadota bacterium]